MSPAKRILYTQLSEHYSNGLRVIIQNMQKTSTVADMVENISDYILELYYTSQSSEVKAEILSISYSTVNSYLMGFQTSIKEKYNPEIDRHITELLASCNSIEEISQYITNIEEGGSNLILDVDEVVPLLLIAKIGQNTYSTTQTENFAGYNNQYSSSLSCATMEGALMAYVEDSSNLTEELSTYVDPKMVSLLIGSLTIAAGKIMFNWEPAIKRSKLKLKSYTISSLNQYTYIYPALFGTITTTLTTTTTTLSGQEQSKCINCQSEGATTCYTHNPLFCQTQVIGNTCNASCDPGCTQGATCGNCPTHASCKPPCQATGGTICFCKVVTNNSVAVGRIDICC
jgi:hypothetical protein